MIIIRSNGFANDESPKNQFPAHTVCRSNNSIRITIEQTRFRRQCLQCELYIGLTIVRPRSYKTAVLVIVVLKL